MKRLILLLTLTLGLYQAQAQSACAYNYAQAGNNVTFTHAWPIALIYTLDSVRMDFGDGNTTLHTAPVPTTTNHTYANPGSYYACLTRYLSQLGSTIPIVCTYCDSIVIGGTQSCNVSVSASASGSTITTSATASGGVAPYTYSYNLMPGNITNGTGVFTGLTMGSYTVCVTAFDAMQNMCSIGCDSVFVGNTIGCFTSISTSVSGNTITATASSSGGTAPYTYSYNLMPGNITNSTGIFTGLANGTYVVCATSTDANNLTCTQSCNTVILGTQGPCSTTISTSVSGSTATATATTVGGTGPYTYSYTLNPGNITNSTGVFPGLTNGGYVICVTATDTLNQPCTPDCDSVFIGSQPGQCNTSVSVSGSGTTVTATATASFGAAPYTYSYTLNPGNITNATGVFTGLTPGVYTVCATATDANNQTCIPDCDSVTLGGSFFCTTTINVSASGNTVTAVGTASGGTGPYTYSYNLNPGNITNSTGIFPGLANGAYTVCVTAIDANQTTCSIACDSTFVGNSTGCITTISTSVSGNTVTSVGSASGGTGPYTYSYTLNPGNITNSTGIFPGLANGWYGVCVTATDAMQNVCSIACDSAFVNNSTLGCNVTAAFTESVSGLTVSFTNNSTITNGTITNYAWNFGDGNGSTTASPTHTYATNGVYNVVLVVTGYDPQQNQCIDSTFKTITINATNTAVGNVNTQKLSIYPNPTAKNFVIELPKNEKLQSLVLTDVSGRKLPAEYVNLGNKKLSVSLKDEAFGIYFIKLQTDKNIYTSSIMKQE